MQTASVITKAYLCSQMLLLWGIHTLKIRQMVDPFACRKQNELFKVIGFSNGKFT